MSKLDEILQARGKYSAEVERGERVLHGLTNREAKEQVKDLVDGIIFESDYEGGPKTLRSEADILEGLADL